MDLAKAHHFFDSKFRCVSGNFDFRGQLLAAPMEESSVYFLLPRRILKLDSDSAVDAGAVVSSYPSGNTWLCADNGPSEFQGRTIYKSLKLFEVTHKTAQWYISNKTTDTITGLPKKGERTPHAVIPVSIEFVKLQEDEMRIPSDLVRIITNAAVNVGDRINEYTITNVETQIGLRFATAKRQ